MKRTLHLNLAQAIKLMLITLMCLPVWSTAVQAQTKEAYAVLDEATGTLTFKSVMLQSLKVLMTL